MTESDLLSIDVADIRFPNPVTTASRTCGYGLDLKELIEPDQLSNIFIKGLSAKTMRQ